MVRILLTQPSAAGVTRQEPPPVSRRAGGGILCGAMGAGSFMAIEPEQRAALLIVDRHTLRSPYHVRYELLESAVYMLASRAQRRVLARHERLFLLDRRRPLRHGLTPLRSRFAARSALLAPLADERQPRLLGIEHARLELDGLAITAAAARLQANLLELALDVRRGLFESGLSHVASREIVGREELDMTPPPLAFSAEVLHDEQDGRENEHV